MQSYYIWKEKLQETVKVLTTIIRPWYESYSTLAAMAQSFHPYSVPEIIATDISNGLNQYLAWIDKSTQQ